jgi:hypothetical protein
MRNETSQDQEDDEKTHIKEEVVLEKVFKYGTLYFFLDNEGEFCYRSFLYHPVSTLSL